MTIKVPVYVMTPEAVAAGEWPDPPTMLNRSELPPMPWRRGDAETSERVVARAERLREQGPYMRVVVRP